VQLRFAVQIQTERLQLEIIFGHRHERAEVGVLIRQVKLPEENLVGRILAFEFRVEGNDRRLRGVQAMSLQMKRAGGGGIASGDRDLAGEIRWSRAEETREIAEIVDRSGNVAPEIRFEPVRRALRQRSFAGQSQLVVALLDVDLLDLHLPVVE